MDQTAYKPGSVPPADADATVIPLDRPLRDGSRDQPGSLGPATVLPCSVETSQGARSLFGLAPGGACHAVPVAGPAVRSYRTLSPLPSEPRLGRRFALCGAFPRVAPGGCCPPPCRYGARTFLPRAQGAGATARPSDPPARCDFMRPCAIGRLPPSPGPPPARRGTEVQSTPVTVSTAARRRIAISRARVSPQASPSTRSGRQCRWKAATV
jgi:hypothetical protein